MGTAACTRTLKCQGAMGAAGAKGKVLRCKGQGAKVLAPYP
jgi:hypothetical protein